MVTSWGVRRGGGGLGNKGGWEIKRGVVNKEKSLRKKGKIVNMVEQLRNKGGRGLGE